MQKQVPGLQKDSSFLLLVMFNKSLINTILFPCRKKQRGERDKQANTSNSQLVSSLAISCTQIPMLSLSNSTKQTVLMVDDMVATKQLEMALRISWAAVCFGNPFLTEKTSTHTHTFIHSFIHYVRGQHMYKHNYQTGQYYAHEYAYANFIYIALFLAMLQSALMTTVKTVK